MKISRVFIVFLVFCFILTTSLSAQGLTAKGFKGGLNLANFTGSDTEIFDIEPSIDLKFAIGGFLNFEVNDQFSIRPEVYYSSKGAKYEEGGHEAIVTMNYIDVPILAVINVGNNFGLFAGPQMGFYLNGKMKANGESEDIESDEVKSTDFALVFGANVYISQFHIDARYALGLSKVPDEEGEDIDLKHGIIQVFFGIAL